MNSFKMIVSGIIAVLAVSIGMSAYYTVDEGERAVLVTTGKVSGVAEPGMHFKMPILTSANHISTRAHVEGYENLQAYTYDQQIATVENISINYRIRADGVEHVYTEFKTPAAVVDRFVGRRTNEVLEQIFGQYTAEKAVRERTQLSADISKALRAVPEDAPIEILSVQVGSISFPTEYNERINARMGAEVEVAKLKQEVLQEDQRRQQAALIADASAYATKAKAQAEAEATRMKGDADAAAIKAKGAALRDNPGVIQLTTAENWKGLLPTTMVPGSAVPFINMPTN